MADSKPDMTAPAAKQSTASAAPALPPFHHTEAYPDAGSVFGMSLAPLEEVKERAIVVLDTNVLLVPYTVTSKSLDAIRSTYQMLREGDRLFIPAQVAREFATQRANKLGEMFMALNRTRNGIRAPEAGEYPLLRSMEEYLQLDELERDLKAKLQEYHKTLSTVLDKVRAWRWDDPVSALYREIFTEGAVAEHKEPRTDTEKFLSHRRANRLAPGYKDAGKDDGGVGDALIWRTILHLGSEKNADVIFVSLDEKPDWWHRSEKMPLYPRFDLANEFWRSTNGRTFHQVRFSDMLALFEAPRDVIADVRQEEVMVEVPLRPSESVRAPQMVTETRATDAVIRWVLARFPKVTGISAQSRFPDLLAELPTVGSIGIEVKVFRPAGNVRLSKVLLSTLFRGNQMVQSGHLDAFLTVIVAEDRSEAKHAIQSVRSTIRRMLEDMSLSQMNIVVGYLDSEGVFIALEELIPSPLLGDDT
jgi:rRNA-processing protein FCF1